MKLAIITGASAGIGLALAKRLLRRKYAVVNLSRRVCPLEQVNHIPTDLSNPGFFGEIGDALLSLIDGADTITLIHNASRYLNDDGTNMHDAALRDVVEVNVIAPNALNRNIVPHMKPGSSVLFIGSTLSQKAVKGCFSYITTKHAQVGMMRSLCQDLVGQKIHTACVCPGFTDTEMLRSHVPEDRLPDVAEMSTFGRLITPDEIAGVIEWVAENPVMNGSIIHANLGQIEN